MAETVRGVSALQNELEKAKESLKDVDENIKKLTGRDPTIQRTPQQRRVALGSADRGGRTAGTEGRIFNLARRGIIQEDTPSPVKRSRIQGGAFSRLGPLPGRDRRGGGRGRDSGGEEDDGPHRPAIQSSVIATSREERSRQNSIEEQSRDRKGQARNRRMFGLLLGTLQKFKDDAAVTKDKEEQRHKIEKKLEEKFKQEKEEIIQERRQLFLDRRQKQFRIRLLEQKMEMAQNHENWERETRKQENFIITKSKPCLFYLPKTPTADTEVKLAETREAITAMIKMRRKKLEEEIAEMMSQAPDEGMDEGDEHGESGGEEMDEGESEGEDKHHENKENDERERLRESVKKEEENEDEEERRNESEDEREKRDRDRVERDRDRQVRDRSGEGRKIREKGRDTSKDGRDASKDGRDTSKDGRDRSKDGRDKGRERDSSDARKDRERERHREKGHKRGHSRLRSRERERHRSGKNRSDRKRDHSDDEKSRSHSSKSKRRSRGESKHEKKEKVWAPMEDEVEEEFVGSRETEKASEKSSIASKMLAMAGMTEVVKELKASEDLRQESASADMNTASAGELRLEDIPRPPPGGAGQESDDADSDEGISGDGEEKRSQLEPVQP